MNELDGFLFKAILQAIKNQINTEIISGIEQKLQRGQGLKFSDLFNRFNEVKNS